MQVESRTSSCLHLKRAPGIRSWSLLVGKDFHISPQIRNLIQKKMKMKLFSVLLPPSIAIVLLLCIVLVFILSAQLLLYLRVFTEDLSFFSPFNILTLILCTFF